MAIGLAKFFNINLPANFLSPYKSSNIIIFWRNWHITLSNFLRDYVYIPLGGNRYGNVSKNINLFTTMIIGALHVQVSIILWGGIMVYFINYHNFKTVEFTIRKL